MSGDERRVNILEINFKLKHPLHGLNISTFNDSVPWSANFDSFASDSIWQFERWDRCDICLFPGLPSEQVLLMLFALSMRKIAAFIGVKSQAKSAFVGSNMVDHEIRILLQVNGFSSQLMQSFASFDVGVCYGHHWAASCPASWPMLHIHFN